MFFWILLILAVILLTAAAIMFKFAVSRKGLVLPGSDEFGGAEDPLAPYREKADEGRARLAAWEKEEVTVISRDGLHLRGLYMRCRSGRPERILLMAHGYRGSYDYDFCCSAPDLLEENCDVLCIDERSHGGSEGKYICYGVRERYDIQEWCRYLSRREPELPIYLMGVSMGCSTVLMAAGLELPETVSGVVADCGYTSPADIFSHFCTQPFHIPDFPLVPLTGVLCRWLAGFDIHVSTLDSLKKTALPIFFVHGDADDFVPTAMTLTNYEAYEGPKELWLTPGVKHAASYVACADEYRRRLLDFFTKTEM